MSLRYSFIGLLKRCLFFSIFIVQVSLAQGTGTIRGIVYDATTKDVLPGANVIVDGTSIGAASDLDGKFVLRGVPSGNQIIVASYIGYVADSLELNVSANRSIELNFNLVLTTVEGGEVIVTAQAQGQLEAINQQLASDKIANIVSEARIQELPILMLHKPFPACREFRQRKVPVKKIRWLSVDFLQNIMLSKLRE